MKRTKLIVHEPSVNRILGSELRLELSEEANLVTAIDEVDRLIDQRRGFPLSEYGSLLHMIYDPVGNRFYGQVAVIAYLEGGEVINLRADPMRKLSVGVTVVLIPSGGCTSEWKKAMDFQEFKRAMQGS